MAKKQDRPVAVAPSPEFDDAQRKSQTELREAFWRVAERIGERNRDLDPEAELAFITEVVEEVRQEMYERERAQAKSSR